MVVGVTTVEELWEIIHAFGRAVEIDLDFDALAIDDEYYLHPGNWPQVAPK